MLTTKPDQAYQSSQHFQLVESIHTFFDNLLLFRVNLLLI